MIAQAPKISAKELKEKIDSNQDLMLIDVRESYEFTGYLGHIKNSHLIPLKDLPALLPTIPKDQIIITICRSGNRSLYAASFLQKHGYQAISLDHGMIEWNNEGFEIEK